MSNLERMRRAVANKTALVANPAAETKAVTEVYVTPDKPAKKADATKETPRPKPVPPPRKVLRLPAGSRKVLVWDGELWHGELSVPGIPEPMWFEAEGERQCFVGLHAMYEAWLRKNTPAEDKS